MQKIKQVTVPSLTEELDVDGEDGETVDKDGEE